MQAMLLKTLSVWERQEMRIKTSLRESEESEDPSFQWGYWDCVRFIKKKKKS